MLTGIKKTKAERAVVERLLTAVVVRAREPLFFEHLKVADTIDGRFDLTALHVWMVLERLREQGSRSLQQRLTDTLFTSFDEGLRELGAGDIGIGRRMKNMADAFYGRLSAYSGALDYPRLLDALIRNIYRGNTERQAEAGSLARYVETARASVAACDARAGELEFGPMPRP